MKFYAVLYISKTGMYHYVLKDGYLSGHPSAYGDDVMRTGIHPKWDRLMVGFDLLELKSMCQNPSMERWMERGCPDDREGWCLYEGEI